MNEFNAPNYDPRMLQNIFLFMLIGQVVLFLMALYQLSSSNSGFIFNPSNVISYSLPIMVILSNFIADRIYKQQFNRISEIEDLNEKMKTIQQAHIIQWAIVEGGTLVLLVFAILESNHYYSSLAFLNIIYFTTLRPKILMLNEGF